MHNRTRAFPCKDLYMCGTVKIWNFPNQFFLRQRIIIACSRPQTRHSPAVVHGNGSCDALSALVSFEPVQEKRGLQSLQGFGSCWMFSISSTTATFACVLSAQQQRHKRIVLKYFATHEVLYQPLSTNTRTQTQTKHTRTPRTPSHTHTITHTHNHTRTITHTHTHTHTHTDLKMPDNLQMYSKQKLRNDFWVDQNKAKCPFQCKILTLRVVPVISKQLLKSLSQRTLEKCTLGKVLQKDGRAARPRAPQPISELRAALLRCRTAASRRAVFRVFGQFNEDVLIGLDKCLGCETAGGPCRRTAVLENILLTTVLRQVCCLLVKFCGEMGTKITQGSSAGSLS